MSCIATSSIPDGYFYFTGNAWVEVRAYASSRLLARQRTEKGEQQSKAEVAAADEAAAPAAAGAQRDLTQERRERQQQPRHMNGEEAAAARQASVSAGVLQRRFHATYW